MIQGGSAGLRSAASQYIEITGILLLGFGYEDLVEVSAPEMCTNFERADNLCVSKPNSKMVGQIKML